MSERTPSRAGGTNSFLDPRFRGRRWPSRREQLLLVAATDEGDTALAAWQHWLDEIGLDNASEPEYPILPIVAGNLRRHGALAAQEPRLTGLYRFNWSRNQLQFRRAASALATLGAGGVESMLLKGSALIAGGYYESGARTMADVDIMVRPRQADNALRLLEPEGWRRSPERGPAVSRLTSIIHGIAVLDGRGANLDLHWHMLHRACSPSDDDAYWAAATPVEFAGRATSIPAPTDLLLLACVHGAAWTPSPSYLWVADALTIMRRSDIDWARLTELGIRHRVSIPLERALGYLQTVFAAPVSESAIKDLARAHAGWLDRGQYAIEGGGGGAVVTLARDIGRYLAITSGRPPMDRLKSLPPYLQTVWKVDSPWRLPAHLAREAMRRSRAWASSRRDPARARTNGAGGADSKPDGVCN